MPILDAQRLFKRYGVKAVVDDVSFHVEQGEIVGLLGPNGAGKTTCFNICCGLIEPSGGTVFLSGKDVTGWSMSRRAREGGMGYLAQDSSVFRKLTVEQNLLGMMELIGISAAERRARSDSLIEQFKIEHVRRSKAGRLSGGERRRVEIARCLVSQPDIILLDEPFNAIDPVTVQDIQALIRELAERGIAILITDHKAEAILRISSRVYVLDEGKVLTSGDPPEVARHPDVRRKYLGNVAIDLSSPSGAEEPTALRRVATHPRRTSADAG